MILVDEGNNQELKNKKMRGKPHKCHKEILTEYCTGLMGRFKLVSRRNCPCRAKKGIKLELLGP